MNDQLVELMGGKQEGLVEVKPGQTQVGFVKLIPLELLWT